MDILNEGKENRVQEPTIKIVSEEQKFRIGKLEANVVTGFIDVEKFFQFEKEKFFLEKKLPFQILVISSPECVPYK